MASEHDSPVHVSSLFRVIIFAPLIVVGLLVLLASWLAILNLFSWLSSNFQEYRAQRRIDDDLAPTEENGMVETRHVENVHSAIGELKVTPKTFGSLSVLLPRGGPGGR
ncbi:hypothetical protein BDR22DRAFT_884814 [Usnea florida]